jgi:hypothetical protein
VEIFLGEVLVVGKYKAMWKARIYVELSGDSVSTNN